MPRSEDEFWSNGHRAGFVPGAKLGITRQLLTLEQTLYSQGQLEADARQIYFAHGAMRVAGREYNDLLASPCFWDGEKAKNKMGCLSCHRSHDAPANDQLNPELTTVTMCTQCHEVSSQTPDSLPFHQLHRAGQPQPSASCVDCHMPKTSYALRKAIRSHRIVDQLRLPDSESILSAGPVEAPPSCVLCHIKEPKDFFDPHAASTKTPYSFEFILSGDAGVRAIMAEAFAKSEQTAFARQVLMFLIEREPYRAVQHIAKRALKQVENNSPSSLSKTTSTDPQLHAFMVAAWSKRDQRPLSMSE